MNTNENIQKINDLKYITQESRLYYQKTITEILTKRNKTNASIVCDLSSRGFLSIYIGGSRVHIDIRFARNIDKEFFIRLTDMSYGQATIMKESENDHFVEILMTYHDLFASLLNPKDKLNNKLMAYLEEFLKIVENNNEEIENLKNS